MAGALAGTGPGAHSSMPADATPWKGIATSISHSSRERNTAFMLRIVSQHSAAECLQNHAASSTATLRLACVRYATSVASPWPPPNRLLPVTDKANDGRSFHPKRMSTAV